MRESIESYISSQLKNKLPNIKFSEEFYYSIYNLIKKASAEVDKRTVNLTPLSFGTEEKVISAQVVRHERIYPHIAIEDFSDKILYIERIENLNELFYIKQTNPKAVITNSFFHKPIYADFPILHSPSIISTSHLKINLELKKERKEFKNFYIEKGIGAKVFYIHFPFDERFCDIKNLGFYGSFQSMLELTYKLLTVNHPKGFSIKFLFSNTKFSNYEGLRYHLKNERKQVMAIFHIENSGLGNEKVIYKTDDNILNSYYYRRIKHIFKKLKGSSFNEETTFQKLKDYSTIGEIKVPIIWITSQPNSLKYEYPKDFLDEAFILEYVNNAFYLINNLYSKVNR